MGLNLAKLFCLALCLLPSTLCDATVFNTDICIYGGTAAGVTAAVQAHDFEQDVEHAAIAMEYVDGWSLWTMRVDKPSGVFEANEIAPCVADFSNREANGVLVVPKAGEMLYRLKNPPKWAGGNGS